MLIAFHDVVAVDQFAHLQNFLVGKLINAALGRNFQLVHDLLRAKLADAVNVLERDDDALAGRKVDACDAGHRLFSIWAAKRELGGAWVDPRPVEAGPCGYLNQKTGFAPKERPASNRLECRADSSPRRLSQPPLATFMPSLSPRNTWRNQAWPWAGTQSAGRKEPGCESRVLGLSRRSTGEP
jgi:hypothetical protein